MPIANSNDRSSARETEGDADEAYLSMQNELRSRECALIESPASGPDRVYFCGKLLGRVDSDEFDRLLKPFSDGPSGVFRSTAHALRALAAAAKAAGFSPNVYRVNERGNVDLLHPVTGRVLRSWV